MFQAKTQDKSPEIDLNETEIYPIESQNGSHKDAHLGQESMPEQRISTKT